MLSTDYSSTAIANAVPINVITAVNLAEFLNQTDSATKTWLGASGFTGAPYTFSLVPSATGNIARVVVGAKALDDVYLLSHLPFSLPPGDYRLADDDKVDKLVGSLSWLLGSYQFTRYKSSPRKTATLLMPASPATKRAQQMFDAVALTRDLVNTPTEDMGPQHLAAVAEQLAAEFGGTFKEIVGDDLLRENFPAIHAVGRASHRPPRLVELRWGNPAHPRVALVGKGVCFDTGGLNIKGADGMRQMKKDMGGAAHALALARLVMQMKLPVSLQVLVPAVENAIAGNAYRPGEIVSTRAGLKIEIGNTDAEGRVVLSDALAYAAESKPILILDFATLTGAARVALGPELPATFANDDKWFDALAVAAKATQDPIWRMPLWQPYNDLIKSSIGDIVNTGGPQAGAVTAALFLERFIPSGQAWMHIDVFSWNPKSRPGRPDGGEAQSLRACFQMLENKFSG
jgi:leucyl aminopeptidase